MVATTDSTAPSAERIAVALTSILMPRPVGNRQHDLLGAHGRRLAQLLRQAKLVEGDLLSIGEPAPHRLQQSLPGLARRAHGVDNPPRLLIERHRYCGPGVEDHDAHRRSLDQGLQIGPGPLLVPVRARVGDRRRRLRRKQYEDLFVLARELLTAFLCAEEEVADVLAPVTHRSPLCGLRQQRVGGQAARADVGGQVPQSRCLPQVSQVLEEPPPVAPVDELPVLVGREAGADEVLDLPAFVDGRDHTVSGAGQRARRRRPHAGRCSGPGCG